MLICDVIFVVFHYGRASAASERSLFNITENLSRSGPARPETIPKSMAYCINTPNISAMSKNAGIKHQNNSNVHGKKFPSTELQTWPDIRVAETRACLGVSGDSAVGALQKNSPLDSVTEKNGSVQN